MTRAVYSNKLAVCYSFLKGNRKEKNTDSILHTVDTLNVARQL